MADFKKIIKDRLLGEMLAPVAKANADEKLEWSVLILDAVTTRVMSQACKISDLLDYGISLTENHMKNREPLPALAGIYFITATDQSVAKLINDWKIRPPYKVAHVFFSSKLQPAHLDAIRSCNGLTARLRSLKEVNVELLVVDKRTFITDEQKALATMFGESSGDSVTYLAEIGTIANRLASVFASLKDFPTIRFRAAKPLGEDGGSEARGLLAQRVAVELHERVMAMQRSDILPQQDTCELIILDRGFDPVAPIIHEWTYEAMAYDMLPVKDGVFIYEAETQGGRPERKEHMLAENDDIWEELQHKHFAAASTYINEKFAEFRSKNKAAGYQGQNQPQDMRSMRQLVASLPQYREQLAKLSVHIEIASKLNDLIGSKALMDLGKLEQDLVYGEATSKEVITYLSSNPPISEDDKVRLLMCYVATHPEKMDATKEAQWRKLAKLSEDDMAAINNLEFLGVAVRKRGNAGLAFGRRRKRANRKDRGADEDDQQFSLSRFVPMLQEIVEDLANGKLSSEEFPYVKPPEAGESSGSVRVGSVRTKAATDRTTAGWAKRAGAGENGSGTPTAPKSKRIIVFVIGGVTRSEMRVVHRLSTKLGRPILLGGTSVDNPASFLKAIKSLSTLSQVNLDLNEDS